MTTAAFIRKWLANPEKHYDEHCRNEMLDDLYSVIEQAQPKQKLNIHGIVQGQPSCPKCGKIDWIYSPKDECVKCLTCWEAARSVASEGEGEANTCAGGSKCVDIEIEEGYYECEKCGRTSRG